MMRTPHAIETLYRGHTFRSRLEARWAAMFDVLGWTWTYEPFDCAGYIPDFVLHGDRPVLVEIKPVFTFDELAAHASRIEEAIVSEWTGDYLVLGARVGWIEKACNFDGWPVLGALGEYTGAYGLGNRWVVDRAVWISCTGCNPSRAAFVHETSAWTSRPCGHGDGDHFLGDIALSRLESQWGTAHERTRWMPGRQDLAPSRAVS